MISDLHFGRRAEIHLRDLVVDGEDAIDRRLETSRDFRRHHFGETSVVTKDRMEVFSRLTFTTSPSSTFDPCRGVPPAGRGVVNSRSPGVSAPRGKAIEMSIGFGRSL